ncbi:MAG: hypothetical protein INQ03_19530 [Candidatus Heimdallarchaeota archaeon]|nr:hypothetical protein [Candidatus Heimdallarchaeota archaeon]
MSISKFIDSARVARAKKISSKKVLEFEIIKKDPLITFMVIQGSSRDPYIVIIDLEKREAVHSCPDFNRRYQYCKHFGKLFLSLDPTLFNQFASVSLHKISVKVKERLQGLKSAIISENIESEDFNEDIDLKDAIMSYLDSKSPLLLSYITNSIKAEIKGISFLEYLNKVSYYLEIIPGNKQKVFAQELAKDLEDDIISNLDVFFQTFNAKEIIYKLEICSLLSHLCNRMNIRVPLINIQFNNLSKRELGDTIACIDLLYQFNSDIFEQILHHLPSSFNYNNEISEIYHRILRSFTFSGSRNIILKNWINHKLKRSSEYLFTNDYIDEYLKYIMLSNNERFNYKVSIYKELGHISTKLLEANPGFRFIIGEIKQSEREYITQQEYNDHRTFFEWLKQDNKTCSYIEKPRNRVPEALLNSQGIIVQWKLNINQVFPEKFEAFDGSTRLVLEQHSPHFKVLQPFDFTLNDNIRRNEYGYTKSFKAQYIITSDQVVNLVLQGNEIISNVLPWHLLSKFANTGYINGGEVSLAITECINKAFIYGSVALKSALIKISKLGKTGLSNEIYEEMHKVLKSDTGRLNATSRPLAKNILNVEGDELQELLNFHSHEETKQLLLIIKSARSSNSVLAFRKSIIDGILRSIINDTSHWVKFLQSFAIREDIGHYFPIKLEFKALIKKELEILKKQLEKEIINTHQLFKKPLGELICSTAKISPSQSISDFDREEINKQIKNIHESM